MNYTVESPVSAGRPREWWRHGGRKFRRAVTVKIVFTFLITFWRVVGLFACLPVCWCCGCVYSLFARGLFIYLSHYLFPWRWWWLLLSCLLVASFSLFPPLVVFVYYYLLLFYSSPFPRLNMYTVICFAYYFNLFILYFLSRIHRSSHSLVYH